MPETMELPMLIEERGDSPRSSPAICSLDVSEIVRKHVQVTKTDPTAWRVSGFKGRRSGQVGEAVAIIAFRHSPGYELILRFPDGKTDSFAPDTLLPANNKINEPGSSNMKTVRTYRKHTAAEAAELSETGQVDEHN